MSSIISSAIPSTIVSSSMASATPHVSCPVANATQFPSSDAACAITRPSGVPRNTTSILESCCKVAGVEEFNGHCGYYCLSMGQKVGKLRGCFEDAGVNSSDIFCNAKNSDKAKGDGGKHNESGAPVSVAGLGLLGLLAVFVFAGMMV